MDQDIFERIRRRRQEALALARRAQQGRFNPHRVGVIHGAEWTPATDQADRGTLRLDLGGGESHELPHFHAAHARHLVGLSPEERTGYLREVWLLYASSIAIKGSREK